MHTSNVFASQLREFPVESIPEEKILNLVDAVEDPRYNYEAAT